MRKRLSVLVPGAGLLLIAAGTAVFAQFQSGSYGSTKTNSLAQTISPQLSQDGNFSVASFPSFATELAEGEGRAETQSFCAMCHSTRYITIAGADLGRGSQQDDQDFWRADPGCRRKKNHFLSSGSLHAGKPETLGRSTLRPIALCLPFGFY